MIMMIVHICFYFRPAGLTQVEYEICEFINYSFYICIVCKKMMSFW